MSYNGPLPQALKAGGTASTIGVLPVKSGFLYYCSTSSSGGVTGNGAQWGFGNHNSAVFTKDFDINNDVTFPGNIMTFTAPVKGIYLLTANVLFGNVTAAMVVNDFNIATSVGGSVWGSFFSNDATGTHISSASTGYTGSVLANMNVSDTAVVEVNLLGGAGNTANVLANGTVPVTFFSGILLGTF